MFRFATGKGPWREMAANPGDKLTSQEKERIANLKAKKGQMPIVPERIRALKDPYIDVLLEAMERCYRFQPEERPTAREVAEFLEWSKKQLDSSIAE